MTETNTGNRLLKRKDGVKHAILGLGVVTVGPMSDGDDEVMVRFAGQLWDTWVPVVELTPHPEKDKNK